MPNPPEDINLDQDDEFVSEPTKKPDTTPAKPKLNARMVKEAESYGVGADEIEACESNAELGELLRNERDRISHERRLSSAGDNRKSKTEIPETIVSAEVEEPAAKWELEKDFEDGGFDPALVKIVKKLHDKIGELQSEGGNKKEIAELKKELKELREFKQRSENDQNPLVRRAQAELARHPQLFGDGHPAPNTREAFQLEHLQRYMFGPGGLQEKGKLTNNPEKDIQGAIAFLFPWYTQEEVEEEPAKKPASNGTANGTNRIAGWKQGQQAVPTNRNGAERTGKPGGTRAAVAKAAAKMKQMGIDPGDTNIDDDEDEI